MNRNQKIGVGCGVVGCLGLIVIVIAVGVILYLRSNATRTYNFNASPNVNSNANRNANTDGNSNSQESANTSATNSSSETPSSMSDDDKHKLFQAVGMTQDQELVTKVLKQLGLILPSGTISDDYAGFVKDHLRWSMENVTFINSVNTPEKARAYVDEHLKE